MPLTLKTLANLAAQTICASGPANLASGNGYDCGAFDFTAAGGAGGYVRGYYVLTGTFGATPSAGTALYIYLYKTKDPTGSAFVAVPASTTLPAGLPDAAFFLDGTTSGSYASAGVVDSPGVQAHVLLYNASGVQLNSGYSLTWVPVTKQGV